MSVTAVFFWVGAEDGAPGALVGDFDRLSTTRADMVDDGSVLIVDGAVGDTVGTTA